MDKLTKKLLYDIQVSISSIYDYLGNNPDFKVYSGNKMLKRSGIYHA
ncbi:MAG: hypothetical protein U9Q98_08580 [Bacteroidota bacterium]|nr:hypothetical protein [Bacteroidota bacterium]